MESNQLYQPKSLLELVLTYIIASPTLRKQALSLPLELQEKVGLSLLEKIKKAVLPVTIQKSLRTRSIHTQGICGIQGIDTTRQIITVACNGKVSFCCEDTLDDCPTFATDESLTCICVYPKADQVIVGSIKGKISGWSYLTKRRIYELKAHKNNIFGLSLSPTQQQIASASADSTIKIWQPTTTSLKETTMLTGHSYPVRNAHFIDDYTLISASFNDRTIKVWDLEKNSITASCSLPFPQGTRLSYLSVVPALQLAICGLSNNILQLWDIRTHKMTDSLKGHTSGVTCLTTEFSDYPYVASGSWDSTIKLWDLRMLAPVATLQDHTDAIQSLSTLAGGAKIISGSRDASIKVWDIHTLKLLNNLSLENLITSVDLVKDPTSLTDDETRLAFLAKLQT